MYENEKFGNKNISNKQTIDFPQNIQFLTNTTSQFQNVLQLNDAANSQLQLRLKGGFRYFVVNLVENF